MPTTPYFLPLRFLPSVPLSTPLVSSPLVAAPEDLVFLTFFRWCSGIHSSWYPPAPVAVTLLTGALTCGADLRFLGCGASVM